MFPRIRQDLDGLIAMAKLQWFTSRIGLALQDARWDQAAKLHVTLMRFCTSHMVSEEGWRELLESALLTTVKSEEITLLDEIFSHYLWLGWRGKQRAHMPYEVLVKMCQILEQREQWAFGVHLGRLIQQHYPTLALGPYTTGHFREVQHDSTSPAASHRIIQDYERAKQLLDQEDTKEFQVRLELCQQVHRLKSGVEVSTARGLLRGLDPSSMSAQVQLWYATGLCRSRFWLDRVRALDLVDDLARDVVRHRPGANQGITKGALMQFANQTLHQRSTAELHPTEEDRLIALFETLHGRGSEGLRRAKEILGQNKELKEATSRGWEDFTGLPGHDPFWVARRFFLKVVHHFLSGHEGATAQAEVLLEDDALLQFEAHTLRLLVAIDKEGELAIQALQEASNALLGALQTPRKQDQSLDVLRVLWPSLLEALGQLAPSKSERKAHLDDPKPEHIAYDNACANVGESLVLWFGQKTLEPSYGCWALVDQMIQVKLLQTAQSIATSLLRSGVQPPAERRDKMLGSILNWALRHGQREELRFWLEALEPDQE